MKKNWIKGLDRIAILLAIPTAIFGTHYFPKKYAESNSVMVYLTSEEEAILKDSESNKFWYLFGVDPIFIVFDYPQENGIIAEGSKELQQQAEKHPISKQVIDRALKEKKADPEGALVKNECYGLEQIIDNELRLIPSKPKRYFVGALGAIVFAAMPILVIGISTRVIPRVFKWVKNGFVEPSSVSIKE